MPVGAARPVTDAKNEPGPPSAVRAPGKSASRTPSTHQLSGVRRPTAWRGAGRTASGKTAPLTRNSAPDTASGYDQDSWRVWRQIAANMIAIATIAARPRAITTTSNGQLMRPGSNGTPSATTPTPRVITAPIAPTADRATP